MFQSIKEIAIKIKAFAIMTKEEVLVLCLMILVGLASFGLGRASIIFSDNKSPTSFKGKSIDERQTPLSESKIDSKEVQSETTVVASKTGQKYHFPWCSGAKQITEKNKITFNSFDEARKAGYTPANNCKGLE
jgi:hypothetical protein